MVIGCSTALRAFTPRDQKAVATAAETLRPNPAFDAAAVITELGVGEALVSLLDEKGRPNIVERAFILPPVSRIGPLTPRRAADRHQGGAGVWCSRVASGSRVGLRETQGCGKGCPCRARRFLAQRESDTGVVGARGAEGGVLGGLGDLLGGTRGPRGGVGREGVVEALAKSAARAIGSQVSGREIIRGVLGSILGGRGGR